MTTVTEQPPPAALPRKPHRVRGAFLGLLAGGIMGLLLGAAYWAPVAYFLSIEEMFRESLLGGFLGAIAGVAFFPIIGGVYWAAGGAGAGFIVGAGSDRRAGHAGAILGMWAGGILGGLTNPQTYASAMSGALIWALFGAPIGAAVGSLLGSRPTRLARGAARGLLVGMFVMALGGVWLVIDLTEGKPARLMAGWAGVPLVAGVIGATVSAVLYLRRPGEAATSA